MPFIWGCTNVIIGMLHFRKICAEKSLRKNTIDLFDDLRKLSNFENLQEINCTKTNLANRDEKLQTETSKKLNLENVIENISGNVMKGAEEKLVFNIFQDFLSNRKNYLKNAQMQKLDLINVVNHIKDFIKERFEIKDDDNEEMDEEDLDPFIVDTFQRASKFSEFIKSLKRCVFVRF